MCAGWIKLHRDTKHWQWFKDPFTLQLFIYILISANYEDKYWNKILIKRGELITSLEHLSDGTGLTHRKIRTILDNLYLSGEIEKVNKHGDKRFTHLKVCNYSSYQENTESSNNQITFKQQSNNNQITTTKEYKNIRNKEEYISNKLDMVNFSNFQIQDVEIPKSKKRKSYLDKVNHLNFEDDSIYFQIGIALGKAIASKSELSRSINEMNKQELARQIYYMEKIKHYELEDIKANIIFLKEFDKFPATEIFSVGGFNRFYNILNEKRKKYGNNGFNYDTSAAITEFFSRAREN